MISQSVYTILLKWENKKTSIQFNFLKLNPPPFTTYFGKSPHMTLAPFEMKKTPTPQLKILRFFSNNLSAFRWKLQNIMLLHLSVIHAHFIQTKIYKNCRVCEQIIIREGQYSHTKKRNIAAVKEHVKKVFYRTCDVIWTLII